MLAPDRAGGLDSIVLGLETLEDYETINPSIHFGAIVGRVVNRIAGAQFTLDGATYHLKANDGPNALHGGGDGFDERVWTVTPLAIEHGVAATLAYTSPDGEQNFPGTLEVEVTYTLSNVNEFRVDYKATTDKPTVLNLTNHSYFNLGGNGLGEGDVEDQILLVNADRYTRVGKGLIPTGEIAPVAGTPLDFRIATPIGARLSSSFPDMIYARGYDHNFVLNRDGDGLVFAARAYDPNTGRVLDCFTTEPGLGIYTSNSLDGSVVGSSGTAYRQTEAFTFESQHFPDSPNHPNFPSTVLRPGEEFRSTTIFRFATDNALPPISR